MFLGYQAGPLVSVRIPVDRETNIKKTYAFVNFQHEESVEYAIKIFRYQADFVPSPKVWRGGG